MHRTLLDGRPHIPFGKNKPLFVSLEGREREHLHPNSNMECSGHQVTFQFQLGLVRDKVTADTVELNLKSLKSMACDFVAEKCPANGITRMQERVLLFKHDYQSTNILQVGKSTHLVREKR